jgi:DNA-directed RNA polymerase subunit RPC12/RpoP
MALSFRCENCGKLLSFEQNPGQKVKCPQCKSTVAVPAALASLPQPKGSAAAAQAQADQAPPAEHEPPEQYSEAHLGAGAMSSVMALLMSVLFHVGLAVIFFFILWIEKAQDEREVNPVVVYDAAKFNENAGGSLDETQTDMQIPEPETLPSEPEEPDRLPPDMEVPEAIEVIGGSDSLQPASGGEDLGPPAVMFGQGTNAHHVVFVIDASGSMTGQLEEVRREMLRNIGELSSKQTFHIIFFNDEFKEQFSPGRLVDATESNKEKAALYLDEVRANSIRGDTDPTEALKKAFGALSNADRTRKGKMIFLLTDGDFTGTTQKELLAMLDRLNRGRDVRIFTFFYNTHGGSVPDVLPKIAESHGGKFKQVTSGGY